MTISQNIQNMSCFYVNNDRNRANITLDITNEYPDRLSVFAIRYDNLQKYSGIISGPEDKVEQLKKQLIHEYKYTEE